MEDEKGFLTKAVDSLIEEWDKMTPEEIMREVSSQIIIPKPRIREPTRVRIPADSKVLGFLTKEQIDWMKSIGFLIIVENGKEEGKN